MAQETIPLSFVLDRCYLTWEQASMGIREGWLNREDAVELAMFYLEHGIENHDLIELAGIAKGEERNIDIIVERLTLREVSNEQDAKLLWLRLILAWVYEHSAIYEHPLELIEELYADFGYPAEIRHLIRYNTTSDAYRPQDHTIEQNIKRLYEQWKQYIDMSFPQTNKLNVTSSDGEPPGV